MTSYTSYTYFHYKEEPFTANGKTHLYRKVPLCTTPVSGHVHPASLRSPCWHKPDAKLISGKTQAYLHEQFRVFYVLLKTTAGTLPQQHTLVLLFPLQCVWGHQQKIPMCLSGSSFTISWESAVQHILLHADGLFSFFLPPNYTTTFNRSSSFWRHTDRANNAAWHGSTCRSTGEALKLVPSTRKSLNTARHR